MVSSALSGTSLRFFFGELAPTRASAVTTTRPPKAQPRLGAVRRIDLPPCTSDIGENPRTHPENRDAPYEPDTRPPTSLWDEQRPDSTFSRNPGQVCF